MVHALLFGLEETLWHFPAPVPNAVLYAHCAGKIAPLLMEWSLARDPVDLARRMIDAVEAARREAASGSLLSPDWGEVLDRVLHDADLVLEPSQAEALWAAGQVDGARLGRQLYPDTRSTLEWARRRGWRIGVITNQSSGAALTRRELEGHDIGGAVDAVVTAADVGWLKPHPEIFYAALRLLGTDADETVMIGDSLRTDIVPARMLGMRAVWKRNGRRTSQPAEQPIPPDAAIDDLWELQRLPLLAEMGAA